MDHEKRIRIHATLAVTYQRNDVTIFYKRNNYLLGFGNRNGLAISLY